MSPIHSVLMGREAIAHELLILAAVALEIHRWGRA